MEEFELRSQVLLGEDSTRQFKREPSADAKLAGEIVAFANSGGGRIFVGVEKDGGILGMATGAEAEKVGEDMAKIAWDSVRPPFSILTKSIATSDGIVVVVEIPDGASKPYCDNKGVYWVKNGPDKRRVQSPEELARLFQLGEKLYAENQPVAVSTLEDFDRDRFTRFYEAKYSEPAPDPSIDSGTYMKTLENLELVEGNRVTVAGLLLFGKRLPVLLPEMKIDAVWFKGSERSSDEWWDQRIITGTLPEQYAGGMSFLKRWNSRIQGAGSFNQAGRSRWKIENENNNTLKTKGYHFEHNYGHGKQHLSSLLASLIILAFLVHTTLEWMDDKYQRLRKKLPSRKRLFNDIRTLTSYLRFETWEALMDFMLQSFEAVPPKPKTG